MTEESIDCDGYVIIDVETMGQFADPRYANDDAVVWGKVMDTHKFSFNDIETIMVTDAALSIRMPREENGQQNILTWPWQRVLHITHRTNSQEVADKLRARDEQEYAKHGMEMLEKVAQGQMISEDEALAHNISQDFLTPCGHMASYYATEADVDVWTCLSCAMQWNSEGEFV